MGIPATQIASVLFLESLGINVEVSSTLERAATDQRGGGSGGGAKGQRLLSRQSCAKCGRFLAEYPENGRLQRKPYENGFCRGWDFALPHAVLLSRQEESENQNLDEIFSPGSPL